jgi:hypothetical protein
MKREGYGRSWPLAYLRDCPDIILESLRKTVEHLTEHCGSPGRD